MSGIHEYTNEQLLAGVESLTNRFGYSPFLGAPAGLELLGEGFPKMLRQLCTAGMVEKTSNKKGSDWYYKIPPLEQEDSSPVTDLHTASLQAAPRILPRKTTVVKPIDGLNDLVASQREIIRLMAKCSSLSSENDKLRAQVAAFSIDGASTVGGSVDV